MSTSGKISPQNQYLEGNSLQLPLETAELRFITRVPQISGSESTLMESSKRKWLQLNSPKLQVEDFLLVSLISANLFTNWIFFILDKSSDFSIDIKTYHRVKQGAGHTLVRNQGVGNNYTSFYMETPDQIFYISIDYETECKSLYLKLPSYIKH